MRHPFRDLHHLWIGPAVAAALILAAGFAGLHSPTVTVIGEAP
jgi:phosphatidylserine/phosphatidylglycerophosphate/cardiolipin synthase-like enzyme